MHIFPSSPLCLERADDPWYFLIFLGFCWKTKGTKDKERATPQKNCQERPFIDFFSWWRANRSAEVMHVHAIAWGVACCRQCHALLGGIFLVLLPQQMKASSLKVPSISRCHFRYICHDKICSWRKQKKRFFTLCCENGSSGSRHRANEGHR